MLTKIILSFKDKAATGKKCYAEFVSEHDKLEFAVQRFPRDSGVRMLLSPVDIGYCNLSEVLI